MDEERLDRLCTKIRDYYAACNCGSCKVLCALGEKFTRGLVFGAAGEGSEALDKLERFYDLGATVRVVS